MALCSALWAAAAPCPASGPRIFDPDPNHIWKRLYASLLIRESAHGTEYGADALDPPLWPGTRHFLLTGDSHETALACLDEFLINHAEHAIEDPLKHALLQRSLWAVFDWAAAGDPPRERRDLEVRLAKVVRRLAVTQKQARALPDSYAAAAASSQFATAYDPRNPPQPFLPTDLLRPNGPWRCISSFSEEPTASVHFSGRSRFLVFMRLPGGRDATLAYVAGLRTGSEPPLTRKACALS